MLYQVKTFVRGNDIKRQLIYIREHWYEWFYVVVDEGEMRPRFYLPVERCINRRAYLCWIFPLAPFVVLLRIVQHASWSVWQDFIGWARLLKEKRDNLDD